MWKQAVFTTDCFIRLFRIGIAFVLIIGMGRRERIWQLITKRMMREASLEEQDELRYLLRNAPLTLQLLQTFTQLWEYFPTSNQVAASLAFEKLREKIFSSEELLGQVDE